MCSLIPGKTLSYPLFRQSSSEKCRSKSKINNFNYRGKVFRNKKCLRSKQFARCLKIVNLPRENSLMPSCKSAWRPMKAVLLGIFGKISLVPPAQQEIEQILPLNRMSLDASARESKFARLRGQMHQELFSNNSIFSCMTELLCCSSASLDHRYRNNSQLVELYERRGSGDFLIKDENRKIRQLLNAVALLLNHLLVSPRESLFSEIWTIMKGVDPDLGFLAYNLVSDWLIQLIQKPSSEFCDSLQTSCCTLEWGPSVLSKTLPDNAQIMICCTDFKSGKILAPMDENRAICAKKSPHYRMERSFADAEEKERVTICPNTRDVAWCVREVDFGCRHMQNAFISLLYFIKSEQAKGLFDCTRIVSKIKK